MTEQTSVMPTAEELMKQWKSIQDTHDASEILYGKQNGWKLQDYSSKEKHDEYLKALNSPEGIKVNSPGQLPVNNSANPVNNHDTPVQPVLPHADSTPAPTVAELMQQWKDLVKTHDSAEIVYGKQHGWKLGDYSSADKHKEYLEALKSPEGVKVTTPPPLLAETPVEAPPERPVHTLSQLANVMGSFGGNSGGDGSVSPASSWSPTHSPLGPIGLTHLGHR